MHDGLFMYSLSYRFTKEQVDAVIKNHDISERGRFYS